MSKTWLIVGSVAIGIGVGAAGLAVVMAMRQPAALTPPPEPVASVAAPTRPAAPTRKLPVLPSRPAKLPDSVSIEYDEFEDYTSLSSWKVAISEATCEMRMSATFSGKVDRVSEPPERVAISLYTYKHAAPADLAFIADGVRVIASNDRVGTGWEWSHFTITLDELATLVNAKSVRGRAGFAEFALDDNDRGIIWDFAASLAP